MLAQVADHERGPEHPLLLAICQMHLYIIGGIFYSLSGLSYSFVRFVDALFFLFVEIWHGPEDCIYLD